MTSWYPIEFKCRGLEKYEIRSTYSDSVDWTWGNIRAKNGDVTIFFAAGPMVPEAVPAERPDGFRSFKVERIGDVLLRYGLNFREVIMMATLTGAPMNARVNLAADPKHTEELLALARALATAPCQATIDRRCGFRKFWRYFENTNGGRLGPFPQSAAPAVPTGLTAQQSNGAAIAVSWIDNSSDETFFQLEKRRIDSPPSSSRWLFWGRIKRGTTTPTSALG